MKFNSIKNVASLVGIVAGVAMFATQAGAAFTFSTNLKQGNTSPDVKSLQQVLNMSADTQVSLSGAGSPGNETNYFGAATKRAVIKWQNKYASEVLAPAGLTSGTGFVGALSRAKLNAMGGTSTGGTTTTGCTTAFDPATGKPCTGGTTPTTTPVSGGVSVSAGQQPVNGLAIQGAARVAFTKFTLTAGSSDVVVNGVTVQRVGAAIDSNFAGIVLLQDDGTQLDIAKTLGSTHQAIIGGTFTVKAGTSMNLTVAGNLNTGLNGNNGQVAGLSVVAVNTTGTVTGSLPIVGAYHTINGTLNLGSLQAANSSFDLGTDQSKAIGTIGQKFTALRLTAGSNEDMRLKSIRFYQAGSAGSGDLSNVAIYLDGTSYSTTVSADGKYYSANFGTGVVIAKGLAKDIWIQGDITGSGSSGRTIRFDVQKNTDLYATGETYGQGVIVTGNVNTTAGTVSGTHSSVMTSTPAITGYAVTVTAGSMTSVSKASSVAAQNVAINLSNQVLGGYDVDLTGEPVSVQSHVFHIATSSAATWPAGTTYITSISLFDENGAVVAGPVDAVADTTTGYLQKVTFTDTVTYKIGKHTYTLKGKIPTLTTNGTVITVTTTPSSDWTNVTGQTTGNSITLTNGVTTLNAVTVKAAALAISMSTSPSLQNIVAGGSAVTFANVQFDASQSGEDVRFSSVAFTKTNFTGISTCQLWDGATALNTGSNVLNPAAFATETLSFDQSLTVAKGTVKTLTLKCNLTSAATGSYTWTVASAPTVTGVTSGATVSATGAPTSASAAQTITTGSLVVSTSPSSPSYAIAAAGTTGNTAAVIRFRATNEGVNLQRLGLILTAASAGPSDLVQVSVWDGATQVGTAVFTGTSVNATSTFATPVALPKDADKDLTVKVDFAQIGTSQPGTQGALVIINADNNGTNTQGTGVSSGTTVNASGSTSVAGVRLFKSFPTIAADPSIGGTGVIDGKVMRFKVTANANGGVGISQFNFTIATTSATVTGLELYGYTDSGYSAPISTFTAGAINGSTQNAPVGALTITPSSVVNIPAGTTYYFELRGSITASATTYAVTTTLKGDASYTAGFAPSYTAGGVTEMASSSAAVRLLNQFMWSPNATTTSLTGHADWANGYGVPGLPSSGLVQTRSN